MPPQNTQKKSLEERVAEIEKYIEKKKQQQISFPLDNPSFQILDDLLN